MPWLVEWLKHKNPLAQLLLARRIQTFLANDLKTDIQARLPLEDVARGLKQYASRMTGGKILLMP